MSRLPATIAPQSYAARGLRLPDPRRDSQLSALNSQLPPDLTQILRPQAYERWLMPSLRAITPQYIEQVLRGAVLGNHILTWALFDLMEDTWPRLVKALKEIKQAVVALDWQIKPWAEEDTPPTATAQERAKLVSAALWRMQPDPAADEDAFPATIWNILDAVGKGVSVQEILWHTRTAGPLGEIIAPRATAWVRPVNYAWGPDGRMGLNAQVLETSSQTLSQTQRAYTSQSYSTPGNVVDFPEDKFLISVFKAKTGHPLGGALLRSLAWWWCAGNFSANWLLNLAQVFGLPFRMATYEPNAAPATIAKINDMLESMGSNAWGSFPAGTVIDFKDAGKTGESSPQAEVLDRADKNCDLLILGQTLTTHQGPRGSQALGEVHERVKEENVMAAAQSVAAILNQQLIPSILRLNYGDQDEAPEICPEEHKEPDMQAFAKRDQILLQAGVALPEKWFYKRHDIPLPAPGEAVITGAPLSQPSSDPSSDPSSANESTKDPTKDSTKEPLAAKDAQERLTDHVLENLTAVEAKWLGGVRPFFANLVAIAQSRRVTDAEFLAALDRAQKQIPELFHHLDTKALSTALEQAMTSSLLNGASRGIMQRKTSGKKMLGAKI